MSERRGEDRGVINMSLPVWALVGGALGAGLTYGIGKGYPAWIKMNEPIPDGLLPTAMIENALWGAFALLVIGYFLNRKIRIGF